MKVDLILGPMTVQHDIEAVTSLPTVYQHLTLMSNAVDTWCCHISFHT